MDQTDSSYMLSPEVKIMQVGRPKPVDDSKATTQQWKQKFNQSQRLLSSSRFKSHRAQMQPSAVQGYLTQFF